MGNIFAFELLYEIYTIHVSLFSIKYEWITSGSHIYTRLASFLDKINLHLQASLYKAVISVYFQVLNLLK